MAYTSTIDDTSTNGRRATRDRYAVGLASAVVAPSIYPNISDKADATWVWSIGPEPADVGQATILVAGPAATVVFGLGGLFTDGQVIDLTIVRTTAADFVTQYVVVGDEYGTDIAATLALLVDAEVDMSSSAVEGVVTSDAVGPVTALTITVLTIT